LVTFTSSLLQNDDCHPIFTAHALLFWHQHDFKNTYLARVRTSNSLVVCAAGGQCFGVRAAVMVAAGALVAASGLEFQPELEVHYCKLKLVVCDEKQ
jgi:hypothetical protein